MLPGLATPLKKEMNLKDSFDSGIWGEYYTILISVEVAVLQGSGCSLSWPWANESKPPFCKTNV